MNDIEILIRRVQSRLDAALSGEPFSVVHLSLEVKAIIAAYRARCAEHERLRGAAGVMCDLLRTAIGVVDTLADEESEDPDEMRMYRARLVAAVEMWDLPARPADGGAG